MRSWERVHHPAGSRAGSVHDNGISAGDDAQAEADHAFRRRRRRPQADDCSETRQGLDCCYPWNIKQIDVTCENGELSRFGVWAVDIGSGVWPCPVCGRQVAAVGHTQAYHIFRCRTCAQETRLYVRIPIIDCPLDGRQQVAVPWRVNVVKWDPDGTTMRTDSHAW